MIEHLDYIESIEHMSDIKSLYRAVLLSMKNHEKFDYVHFINKILDRTLYVLDKCNPEELANNIGAYVIRIDKREVPNINVGDLVVFNDNDVRRLGSVMSVAEMFLHDEYIIVLHSTYL